MYNNIYIYYQIKKILSQVDEIGTSIRTGLSRVRHRLSGLIDNKSRPNSKMPNWQIFSNWVAPDDDEDDEDDDNSDNGDNGDNNDNNDKNDDNKNGDNSNNNKSNNTNESTGSTSTETTVRSNQYNLFNQVLIFFPKSRFGPPLVKFLNRYSSEVIEYFIQQI